MKIYIKNNYYKYSSNGIQLNHQKLKKRKLGVFPQIKIYFKIKRYLTSKTPIRIAKKDCICHQPPAKQITQINFLYNIVNYKKLAAPVIKLTLII